MAFNPIAGGERSAPQDNMGTSPTQEKKSKTNKIHVPIKQYSKATKKFDGAELNITVYFTKGTKIENEEAFKTEVQDTYETAVQELNKFNQKGNYTFSVKNFKFSVYKERTGLFGHILNLLFGPKKISNFQIKNYDKNPPPSKEEEI